MIAIYILEDDAKQRENLTDIIEKYLLIHNLDSQILLATGNTGEFLAAFKQQTYSIVFLDIELAGSKLSGVDIAEEIRKKNAKAKIIFISSHDELGLAIYQRNIEAFDFIVKGNPDVLKERVTQVLGKLLIKNTPETVTKDIIKLNFNDEVRFIPIQEIQFFCTIPGAPHKLEAHLTNSQFQFYDKLKNLTTLNENLFQCHKAYIVNLKNIVSLDKKSRLITLINGEKIPVAKSKLRFLT